jgi:transcriptional regulator with XRE-family HTH domain
MLYMGEPVTETVAGEVRAEIARQKIDRRKLAADAGMSRSALARRLSGTVPFDVSELQRIAVALGKPAAHFLPAAEVASTP